MSQVNAQRFMTVVMIIFATAAAAAAEYRAGCDLKFTPRLRVTMCVYVSVCVCAYVCCQATDQRRALGLLQFLFTADRGVPHFGCDHTKSNKPESDRARRSVRCDPHRERISKTK